METTILLSYLRASTPMNFIDFGVANFQAIDSTRRLTTDCSRMGYWLVRSSGSKTADYCLCGAYWWWFIILFVEVHPQKSPRHQPRGCKKSLNETYGCFRVFAGKISRLLKVPARSVFLTTGGQITIDHDTLNRGKGRLFLCPFLFFITQLLGRANLHQILFSCNYNPLKKTFTKLYWSKMTRRLHSWE